LIDLRRNEHQSENRFQLLTRAARQLHKQEMRKSQPARRFMTATFNRPRLSPSLARAVWLWGVTTAVVIWAHVAITAVCAGVTDAMFHGKIAGAMLLWVAGWTGAWRYSRRRHLAGTKPVAG
jgi:hypothetical protein